MQEEIESFIEFQERQLKKDIIRIVNSEWKNLENEGLKSTQFDFCDTDCIIYVGIDYDLTQKEHDLTQFKIMPFANEDDCNEYYWSEVEDNCEHKETYLTEVFEICNYCGKTFVKNK